jgi:hypothetical protein
MNDTNDSAAWCPICGEAAEVVQVSVEEGWSETATHLAKIRTYTNRYCEGHHPAVRQKVHAITADKFPRPRSLPPPSVAEACHVLGPNQVLVGHVACLGHGGGGPLCPGPYIWRDLRCGGERASTLLTHWCVGAVRPPAWIPRNPSGARK